MIFVERHVRVHPPHDLGERDRLGAPERADGRQQRSQNHE